MSLRDILIFTIVFIVLLRALVRPHVGVYLWTWMSLMNPHRLAWGPAFSFPFAQVVGIVTIVSTLLSKEPKRMVWSRETVLLLLFVLWMCLTTIFAFHHEFAVDYLVRVLKIEVFVFVTIYLITDRKKLDGLIWVTVLSLGYYGLKGGVFTIVSGGSYHVLGPAESFIGENNALGLATIMTVPLITYLFLQEQRQWLRIALGGAIFLCTMSIIGSQSRGAFLGILAMGAFLWLKSRHKLLVGLLIVVATVAVLAMMPETWWERMDSIRNYSEDSSALGRINAWWTAWNVASSNVLGGGFKMFTRETFLIYAPNPLNVHDAHSIYFQVLGEHGFIGLLLFLLLGGLAWLRCGKIVRQCKSDAERRWAADLAAMLQVSLVGYAVTGAFLGLAYFDYYYHLIAIVVVTWSLVKPEPVRRPLPQRQRPQVSGGGEPVIPPGS